MKRLCVLLLVLLFAVTSIYGSAVNSKTAELVAGNFALERVGASYTVSTSKLMESSNQDSYIYVVSLNPSGFVLVAADDAALPIIGYSTNNNWKENDIPEQMQYMLNGWNDQMRAIVTQRMTANTEITTAWNRYNVSASRFTPNRDFRDVSPLISSLWGQGTYYNALCPAGTPVGCVATAMAQIMRFWRFPTIGQGSHTDPNGGYTANFGATTYNWAAMPNTVSSANASVATIGYHAGIAVDMRYAASGSGAYSEAVPGALISYFRYSNTAQLYNRSSYSTSNWDTMMRGELDLGRPIYYSGSGNVGGHAFILDGYQGTNSFHLNWGWNGSYNGYYTLAALNPGGDTFNNGQQAVMGIKPSSATFAMSEGFEGTTFPPTGWSLPVAGFARSNTNFITGAYSARYNLNGSGSAASGKRICTPKITINASSPALTFKARAGTTLRGEVFKVGYSTSTAGPWTYLADATLSTSVQSFSRTVSGLTPGDYYFVFETYSATSATNSKTWIIDDVAGPTLWVDPNPIASINLTSWAAGSLAPGDASYSGDLFQLSNTGQGTLTVNSITNLSATEFKSNFPASGVSLVNGQILEFGFTYEPLNYGADNQSFVISTNAGNITITLTGSALSSKFKDGFENYTDFTLNFPPWTTYDGDGQVSGGIGSVTYLNSGYTGAWQIFNPSTTTPATGAAAAHLGSKYAMSMYNSSAVANNDWMITPVLSLTSSPTLSFYAMSYSSSYLETFKVYYSTTNNTAPGSFTLLTTVTSVPNAWTYYTYSLPACANQNTVYIAIVNASTDKFMLFVDDVTVSDSTVPAAPTFGNVSGYVYRYGTTTPIVNAMVTAGTKVAYTGVNGFYQINNLLTGTQTLNCNATGQFYFSTSVSGVAITNGGTTTQNFGLKWGELTATPTSVTASLYQGEAGSATITLQNIGGTASTSYAGYISAATRSSGNRSLTNSPKKPSPDYLGTKIAKIDAPAADRQNGWFGYATINDADYFTSATTERGNYFLVNDIAMMDGAVTLSQLRSYFYNPSTAAWDATTNKFNWKVYSVSPTGTITLVHTSAQITLATTTPTNTYLLSTYTIPTAITIPAGYDFIVTVAPTSTTTGKPQSLATSVYSDNGYSYNATDGWLDLGMDVLLDAYVTGVSWMNGSTFSGTITPAGSVSIPLNFTTDGVTAGTKYANMYVYNNSNYVAPNGLTRGDVLVVPIALNVTVATTPVAVLTGTEWITNANVGTPSTSGNIFTLKNVGPSNLTITSVTGLTGTAFTSNINLGMSLAQNVSSSFGFTFTPTSSGIKTATCTIVTNGGTKTITLRGYANYVAEGFEGATFPPDGWVVQDVDADTYNWTLYTATDAAHAGLNCAGSASYINDAKSSGMRNSGSRAALTPNNWLITPRLAVSSGDELSYWIAAQDPAWPAEYYSVKISTTNAQTGSFTTTLLSETLTNGTWAKRTINLTAYAGQSVYIAFQHYNCTDQFVLKLDDVLMPPLAAPLVYGNISGRVQRAVTYEVVVGATVSVAGRTSTTDGSGIYTISNIVVETYPLTITATGYPTYSANVVIPANNTLMHDVLMNYAKFSTPSTTINMSVQTGLTANSSINLSNTGNIAVNWTSDSGVWGGDAFLGANLNQDWEAEDLTGWTGSIGANSDVYGSVTTPYGYNSQNTWVFASNGTTTVQYLISPKLHVNTGDNLAFWYKQFNTSTETFTVKVSTTDNLYASFTNTLATIGPLADTNWTNFSSALSAYAGQNIYVCFEYPRVDGYQYGYIMIDNVTGPQVIAPPTEWLSCSPATGALNASASTPVSLIVNAASLPVGSYTAQAWFFGTAVNSPYKVNVNLTVTSVLGVEAPQNMIIEKSAGILTIAWDEVDNANSYKVYACATLNGSYVPIETTDRAFVEITEATLAASGLDTRAFFKVKADTATRQATSVVTRSSQSSPVLPNAMRPANSKTNRVLQKM